MAALFLAEEGFHVLLCGAEFTQFDLRFLVTGVETVFYPVLLLIVPALYVDLTCSGVEKALQRLVALSGAKEPEKQTDAEPEREQCLEFGGLSALEQAAHMNDSEE